MVALERHTQKKHTDYRILTIEEIDRLIASVPVFKRKKTRSLERLNT